MTSCTRFFWDVLAGVCSALEDTECMFMTLLDVTLPPLMVCPFLLTPAVYKNAWFPNLFNKYLFSAHHTVLAAGDTTVIKTGVHPSCGSHSVCGGGRQSQEHVTSVLCGEKH